jgi:hypothetical protein
MSEYIVTLQDKVIGVASGGNESLTFTQDGASAETYTAENFDAATNTMSKPAQQVLAEVLGADVKKVEKAEYDETLAGLTAAMNKKLDEPTQKASDPGRDYSTTASGKAA